MSLGRSDLRLLMSVSTAPRWLLWATLAAAAVGCSDEDADNKAETQPATEFISIADGAPETTYWDEKKSLLYIVDNKDNQVWTWTEKGGLKSVAKLPSPIADETELPANVTLGQATMLDDGTFVVSRFGQPGGMGGYGGIGFVRDGEAALVPDLDPMRRRLGLTVAPDGVLYGSYFVGGMGSLTSVLTTVDLEGGETDVADGFGKIVGLAIIDDTLYVSDQAKGTIFAAPLDALPEHARDWDAFATLDVPDQITTGPDGSLFTGQFQAAQGSDESIAVRQIDSDGSVTKFKEDPDVSKPSGLSYDAKGKRLYVADSGNSAKIGVHVFAVP